MKRKNALGFSKTNWNSITKLNAINTKRNDGGLMIPTKQAKSMVSMIPDSFFNDSSEYIKNGVFDKDAYADNHRIIDVCCNSGVLLEICYNKFMMELSLANTSYFESNADVEDYILQELLFAFVLDIRLCKMLRERFYHSKDCVGNIFSYNIISGKGSDASLITILDNSIAFGDEVLKFDVVCGNPPYNNDMYLDFVLLGHKLAKTYDLWITPAKFIGMGGIENKNFRSLFKSCARIVKYYDKATDIFSIQLDGGICYYLMNKCNRGKITLNGSIIDSSSMISFDINLLRLLSKVNPNLSSSYNSTVFNVCKSYFCSKQPTEVEEVVNSGYYLVNDRNRLEIDANFIKHKNEFNNYKVFCVKVNDTPLAHILKPNEVYGRAAVLLGYGDLSYCKSIKSFFETRTIWYLVYFSGCANINTESFRFVPDPGSFDKIYEDRPLEGYTPDENGEYTVNGVVHCSLYVKYKLTEDEINVIESVIRERK